MSASNHEGGGGGGFENPSSAEEKYNAKLSDSAPLSGAFDPKPLKDKP